MLYNQSIKRFCSLVTNPLETNTPYNVSSNIPGAPYPPIGANYMILESGEYMITESTSDRMITD